MTFKEGLLYVYQNRKTDGEVTDPFYLYCRLADLTASSYADKKKLKLFYAVDKRLCIFATLLRDEEEGLQCLLDEYSIVSDLLSRESFERVIACAVYAMHPSENKAEVQAEVMQVSYVPPTPIVPDVVQKAEESVRNEPRTPLTTNTYVSGDLDTDLVIGIGAVLVLATLGLVLFWGVTWLFGWDVSWGVWQCLLGLVLGGWFMFIAGFTIYLFSDALVVDYYVSGLIPVIGLAVLNFVLLLIFREN